MIQYQSIEYRKQTVLPYIRKLVSFNAKKIMSRTKCKESECLMTAENNNASMNQTSKKYLHYLSRGDLIIPSTPLEHIVNSCFSVLEYADDLVSNEVKLGTA